MEKVQFRQSIRKRKNITLLQINTKESNSYHQTSNKSFLDSQGTPKIVYIQQIHAQNLTYGESKKPLFWPKIQKSRKILAKKGFFRPQRDFEISIICGFETDFKTNLGTENPPKCRDEKKLFYRLKIMRILMCQITSATHKIFIDHKQDSQDHILGSYQINSLILSIA